MAGQQIKFFDISTAVILIIFAPEFTPFWLIKKFAHITLSLWLAILLLFGGTAKEFFHSFTGHTDTVHIECAHKGDLVIEPKHHHCSFLDYSITPFVNDIQLPLVLFTSTEYFSYPVAVLSADVQEVTSTLSLRGPPAA